jgi:hypothetical protein
MAATAKKVKTLGSVVTKAAQLYRRPSYKEVQQQVQTEHGGFRNWVRTLKNIVANSNQTLLDANQLRIASESTLSKLGFIVGGSLELETEHKDQRDILLRKLIESNLYCKTQSTQLNLLPQSAIADTDYSRNPRLRSLEQTAKEVVRLTSMLDDLLAAGGRLNSNDAQHAFFLRDSIYGLIIDYTKQKQNGAAISNELRQYLTDNKEIFERAVGYSRWSNQLKSALGI